MNLVGNTKTREQLKKLKLADNMSHAYLFCGPKGVGKTSFAKEFAQLLLCEANELEPCNKCESCKLFASGNNPDFTLFDADEPIGVDEMRELIRSLDLSPYRAKYKVVVIANFERATDQSLNSFLKTLEEPTKTTKIILTAKNKKNLLPTIVSRTQIVNFGLVEVSEIEKFITQNYSLSSDKIREIVDISSGKIGNAIRIANNFEIYESNIEASEEFLRLFSSGDINGKLVFADKMAKEKDHLEEILTLLELKIRNKILENSGDFDNNVILKEVKIIDDIMATKDYLRKNVNSKLAIESLLLAN